MNVEFNCPECGRLLAIDSKYGGTQVECPNCKGKIQVPGLQAPAEPVLPQADEHFCSSCGAIAKKAAEICPKCGVRIGKEEYRKSKGVAVILALIFGMLSWLYTWKADKTKFAGVLLLTFTVGIIMGLSGEVGEESLAATLAFGWIVTGIAWLWAVILALVRPQGFYRNY